MLSTLMSGTESLMSGTESCALPRVGPLLRNFGRPKLPLGGSIRVETSDAKYCDVRHRSAAPIRIHCRRLGHRTPNRRRAVP